MVLVRRQGYSVPQACQALNIADTALRRWLAQVEVEVAGTTPTGKALTPEQQRIQALEAQVKRLEMEKAIKKKRVDLIAFHVYNLNSLPD
ncbi:transposase [Nitrospira sp. M1]